MTFNRRGRSPLGAFVRSPLGVLGQEEDSAPTLGTWTVDQLDTPRTGQGLSLACAFGDAGVTLYETTLRAFPSPAPPVAISQQNVRFTGDQSGAVYDWIAPPQCVNTIFGIGDANPLSYPPGTFRAYAIWVYEPGATEYGSFSWQQLAPGETGFIDGERVTLTIPP